MTRPTVRQPETVGVLSEAAHGPHRQRCYVAEELVAAVTEERS